MNLKRKKMKKITVIILMMVAAIGGYAQNNVITDLFDQYYNDENFTKVSVSSKMFDLFTEIEPGDKDEEMILDAISKLQGLKILAADSIGNSRKLFDDAVKKISSKGYEELMEVKDAEEDMKFMIMDTNGKITELVMVVGGRKKFVILSLFGEIDLKSISKLSKSMNIEGLEDLEHIESK
jgi:hypothetical protein